MKRWRGLALGTLTIFLLSAPAADAAEATTATVPLMSAVLIEVMEYSPRPCQVKTVSVMAAPVNSPARAKAKKVPMGISAVRSA